MDTLQSRPYQPGPGQCCEACVFGSGKHADWCEASLTPEYDALFREAMLARIDRQRDYNAINSARLESLFPSMMCRVIL